MLKFLLQTAVGLSLIQCPFTISVAQEILIEIAGAKEHNGAQRVKGTADPTPVSVTVTSTRQEFDQFKLSFALKPNVSTGPAAFGNVSANIPATNNNRDIELTATLVKSGSTAARAPNTAAPAPADGAEDGEATFVPNARSRWKASSKSITTVYSGSNAGSGIQLVSATVPQGGNSASSPLPPVEPLVTATTRIHIDTKGPTPLNPVVDRFPGGSATLTIPFAENDLDPESVSSSDFTIYQEHRDQNNNNPTFSRVLPHNDLERFSDNTQVLLNLPHLSPGVHYLVVHDIKDLVQNDMSAASNQFGLPTQGTQFRFVVSGGSEHGDQVEYPRFLRPEGAKSEFDPGDRVDTRVVQLYYFRDARMVAEYINRNIKDLNQSGYDEAQRFAQQARAKAADKIDERRFKETLAVESAQRTREIENEIQQTQEKLEQTYQAVDSLKLEAEQLKTASQQFGVTPENISGEIVKSEASLETFQPKIEAAEEKLATANRALILAQTEDRQATGTAAKKAAQEELQKAEMDFDTAQRELEQIQDDRNQVQNRLSAQRTIQARNTLNADQEKRADDQLKVLQDKLKSDQLPKQLQDTQVKEIDDRNDVVQAEASELRAAQEEFRREVAAGLADRNSYARGIVESIDPVTQVTISVVGTSRLQLRGPIKGVNKICRMVHQLDSPVGQVKVGIHTVQVNGEHGDRMDFVYERINQEIAHSRFLVSTSGQLLRRAVHEVAAEVALAADDGYLPNGCPPDLTTGIATLNGPVQTTGEQRDRRYLYAFFGSDFISELEEMDSELLNSENKMLSLHSMDTVSLAGALFVMAHADHPVRQRIAMRFQELLAGELPQRETEYVQALTHVTSHGKSLQNRFRTAMRIDNKNASEIYFNAARTYHFPNTISYFNDQIPGQGTLNPVQYATIKMAQSLKAQLVAEMELKNQVLERSLLEKKEGETEETYRQNALTAEARKEAEARKAEAAIKQMVVAFSKGANHILNDDDFGTTIAPLRRSQALAKIDNLRQEANSPKLQAIIMDKAIASLELSEDQFAMNVWSVAIIHAGFTAEFNTLDEDTIQLVGLLQISLLERNSPYGLEVSTFRQRVQDLLIARKAAEKANQELANSEEGVFSKRLLDQFIDEQEEKSVELMEALRAHSSNVDNYLKRLAIAVEDDVAAQFYEPAFQRIRRVSRTYDVTLGQIETTTVLTNNRTLAKVSPSATFEFDLPQRDILLTEALNGSKALANEYGNLLKDGTFLAGTAMLSGQPPLGVIGNNAPIQGIPGMEQNQDFGSELQKLIPDPAIYKFETGTGFEIQPIIQPDGHSIVYGFDYMYSTNVREPVRADEKHLGRIKRHFVHTDVQTSSYELREISRYTVALKASRTDRGVPLFEDLPGIGAAFRPLPSQESSLQTNIILGSSTIYPTVFDLMGLRWSAYVDQLSSPGIAAEKDTQTNRREDLRSHLLEKTRVNVNKRIGFSAATPPKVNHVAPGFAPNRMR